MDGEGGVGVGGGGRVKEVSAETPMMAQIHRRNRRETEGGDGGGGGWGGQHTYLRKWDQMEVSQN